MGRSRRATPVPSPVATPPGDNISTRDIATIVATAQHLAHEPFDASNAIALHGVVQSDVETAAMAIGCTPKQAKIFGATIGIVSTIVVIVLALLRFL